MSAHRSPSLPSRHLCRIRPPRARTPPNTLLRIVSTSRSSTTAACRGAAPTSTTSRSRPPASSPSTPSASAQDRGTKALLRRRGARRRGLGQDQAGRGPTPAGRRRPRRPRPDRTGRAVAGCFLLRQPDGQTGGSGIPSIRAPTVAASRSTTRGGSRGISTGMGRSGPSRSVS